jgi:hypothetical protein
MKERPIPFSGEMVRAILEGRKTQTRRVLRKQPLDILPMKIPNAWVTLQTRDPNHGQHIRCRFGVPGDQLWVRETWKIASFMEGEPVEFQYKADGAMAEENLCSDNWEYEDWYERVCIQSTDQLEKMACPKDEDGIYHWETGKSPLPWRPSIFMPRWASRIQLEIVNIRVERVQEIKTKDIIAEGVRPDEHYLGSANRYRHAFDYLWDSLNSKRGFGWDVNPYVWVIEFKRVEENK